MLFRLSYDPRFPLRLVWLFSLTVIAMLASPVALQGQDTPAAVDSLVQTARRDGRNAAAEPRVGGYFAVGFIPGLALGFFGPLVLVDPEPTPAGFVMAGLGVAGLAGLVGALWDAERGAADPPDEVAVRTATRRAEFERAFREAYAERIRARRRGAVLVGGAAGVAAGVGASYWLLSLILAT